MALAWPEFSRAMKRPMPPATRQKQSALMKSLTLHYPLRTAGVQNSSTNLHNLLQSSSGRICGRQMLWMLCEYGSLWKVSLEYENQQMHLHRHQIDSDLPSSQTSSSALQQLGMLLRYEDIHNVEKLRKGGINLGSGLLTCFVVGDRTTNPC